MAHLLPYFGNIEREKALLSIRPSGGVVVRKDPYIYSLDTSFLDSILFDGVKDRNNVVDLLACEMKGRVKLPLNDVIDADTGFTLLHFACASCGGSCAAKLLKENASVHVKDKVISLPSPIGNTRFAILLHT